MAPGSDMGRLWGGSRKRAPADGTVSEGSPAEAVDPIRQQADAGISRLLRVELRGGQGPVLDGCEERRAVLAPRQNGFRERRLDLEQPLLGTERVDEVETLVLDAAKEARPF